MGKSTNQGYKDAHYDQILVRVKKGKRDEYQQAAAALGIGQMELFRVGVEEYIRNHAGEEGISASAPIAAQPNAKPHDTLSPADKRLLDNLNSLPKSTKAKITALVADIAAVAAQEPRQAAD